MPLCNPRIRTTVLGGKTCLLYTSDAADEESGSPEVSTVEEEELSALMGEKEDYNKDDEQNEEQWED